MRKLFAVFVLVGMMLSGCVYVDMNVKNKPAPGIDFNKFQTFGFKKKSESRQDLEAVLLNSARTELEAKGFTYDAVNPDFVILVNFGSRAFMERGVTYKREAYEYDYLSKTNSEIGVVKTSDAARLDNTVSIYLMTPENEGEKTFLWRGSASSVDFEGVSVMGKCLVKGALIKFPTAQGKFREKLNVRDCE